MGWDTQEYIKYMLVGFLVMGVGIWLLIEATGHYVNYDYSDGAPYIPSRINGGIYGHKYKYGIIEGFNSPNRTPVTIMTKDPTDIADVGRYSAVDYEGAQPPDMGVMRAQRYYDLPEGPKGTIVDSEDIEGATKNQPGMPPSRLFSVTQEMPSTYMMQLLRDVISGESGNGKGRTIELDTRRLSMELQNQRLTVTKMLDMKHADIQVHDTLANLFTQIRLHIISKINESAIKAGRGHRAHPFQLFKIVNSWNLGIYKPQADENTLRFKVDMVLYRGQATHTFNIQAWVDIPGLPLDGAQMADSSTNNDISGINNGRVRVMGADPDVGARRRTPAYIHTLELVGSNMSYDGIYTDQKRPLPDTDGNIDGHTLAPLSTVRIPPELAKYAPAVAMDNTDAVNVNLDKNTRQYLNKQAADRDRLGFEPLQFNLDTQGAQNGDLVAKTAKFDEQLYGPYKCYIIDKQGEMVHLDRVLDPQECQSFHPKYGTVGVWDRPCTTDSECPFYGANTNSPGAKKLGGCQRDTGKCQMPEGVVRVGYRQYAKKSEPRCYGCDKLASANGKRPELERQDACCEQQAKAITNGQISELNSPDYKFANDGR